METREIVEAFVAAINSGKAERIVGPMAGEAVFVDALGGRLEGKKALLDGWRAYLRLFPDYRIGVETMITDELDALLCGRASGTLHRGGRAVAGGRWEIPAAWRARTDGRRILLWQVYADNKPVWELLKGQ